jgi:hypothetical protein
MKKEYVKPSLEAVQMQISSDLLGLSGNVSSDGTTTNIPDGGNASGSGVTTADGKAWGGSIFDEDE